MLRPVLTVAALFLASSASLANNCAAIRSQIESKIEASGVTNFSLSVVEAGASTTGRVVGTCDLGTKKIVYAVSSASASSSGKPKSQPILTECKDGSVSLGGECKK